MSDDKLVEVSFSANNADTATLLLAAAEELDLPQSVVQTKTGVFVVPESVRDKAFGKGKTEAPDTAEVQAEADAKAEEEANRTAPSAEEGRAGYDTVEVTEQKAAEAKGESPSAAKKAPAKKAAAKKSASK